MVQVVIHKNPSLLRHKLSKTDSKLTDNKRAQLVFAVNRLEFDNQIPILKEKHLKIYEDLKKSAFEPIPRILIKTPSNTSNDLLNLVNQDLSSDLSEDDTGPQDRKNISQAPREYILLSDDDDDDAQPATNDRTSPAKCATPEIKREDEVTAGDNIEQQDEQHDDKEKDDVEETATRSACESSIDELVLRGPEEDEFRQYDDNDENEDDSTLSKNLKKIRAEPTKPSVQAPRQPLAHQPFQLGNATRPKTPPPNVKKPKLSPINETTNGVVTISDLDAMLADQKKWRIVHSEIEQHKDTYRTQEVARSLLKKAVVLCLNQDETYALIGFMKLVFEFVYSEDCDFWEMLIGRLKRKVSPHIQDHRFKCEIDPKIVINNYNLVIQEILKHFNSSNTMSNVRIPFHLAFYLSTWAQSERSEPARPATCVVLPVAPVEPDPTKSFDVSLIKNANGKSHFKIKSTKRECKFSPMFT